MGQGASQDWKHFFKNYKGNFASSNLDELALEHINKFWGPYGIKLPYNIEHKSSHLALKSVYFGKSNYALKTSDKETDRWNKIVYKIWGQKPEFEGVRNPYYLHFDNILFGIDKVAEMTK